MLWNLFWFYQRARLKIPAGSPGHLLRNISRTFQDTSACVKAALERVIIQLNIDCNYIGLVLHGIRSKNYTSNEKRKVFLHQTLQFSVSDDDLIKVRKHYNKTHKLSKKCSVCPSNITIYIAINIMRSFTTINILVLSFTGRWTTEKDYIHWSKIEMAATEIC